MIGRRCRRTTGELVKQGHQVTLPATRNVRLAAIHAFFRYCAAEHPDHLDLCQRVLAVPFKRARSRPVEYLEFDEIQAPPHVRWFAKGREERVCPLWPQTAENFVRCWPKRATVVI